MKYMISFSFAYNDLKITATLPALVELGSENEATEYYLSAFPQLQIFPTYIRLLGAQLNHVYGSNNRSLLTIERSKDTKSTTQRSCGTGKINCPIHSDNIQNIEEISTHILGNQEYTSLDWAIEDLYLYLRLHKVPTLEFNGQQGLALDCMSFSIQNQY